MSQDDYNTDIRPDASCQPLPQAVSCIDWIPISMGSIFAVSFWDGSLRVYEVTYNNNLAGITQRIATKAKSPLTKCVWSQDASTIYVGDVAGVIQAFNVQAQTFIDVGKHSAAISALHIVPNQNVIISAAYQNQIHFWQPGNPSPVFSIDMGNKIFCSDFAFPLLVVGMATQKIGIIDINNASNKTILESSDLGKNSQIQSIAINRTSDAIGVSTFDGRSNIANIVKGGTGQYVQKSIITFKSHKVEQNSQTIILYPVNVSSFSPISPIWFMTCGSDGTVNFWDFNVKNKIKSLAFTAPITHAKVSPQGEFIAYGLGNDWHIGTEGNKWQPRLGVHRLTQQQMKFPAK